MKYYVFDTKEIALAAEAFICSVGECPIVGFNKKTGQPAPTKQKTERWAIPRQRFTDGKWTFPALPESKYGSYPQELIDYFWETYPGTIEEYDSTWFLPKW